MPLYSSYGSPLFFFFASLTNFILKPQTVGRGAMRTSSGTGWAVGAWEAVRRPSMQRNHRPDLGSQSLSEVRTSTQMCWGEEGVHTRGKNNKNKMRLLFDIAKSHLEIYCKKQLTEMYQGSTRKIVAHTIVYNSENLKTT